MSPPNTPLGTEPLARPKISFCLVSTGRAPRLLRAAVESVLRQRVEACEILVAGTTEHLPGVRFLPCEEAAHSGRLGHLRNLLARASAGNWLAILDEDVILAPGWYAALERVREPFDILTSRVLLPDGTRHWDHAAYSEDKGLRLLGNLEADARAVPIGGGAWVMTRVVAEAVSWADVPEAFEESDADFGLRCLTKGFSSRHHPEMVAYRIRPDCTQVGRRVYRRSRQRTFDWVRTLREAPVDELLTLALRHADRGETAEVADVVRCALARYPDDARLQAIWAALAPGPAPDESLTWWQSAGNSDLLALLSDLTGDTPQTLFQEAMAREGGCPGPAVGEVPSGGQADQPTAGTTEEHIEDILAEAMVLAGASPRCLRKERPRFAWSAPLFGPSGYSDEAREFILALDQAGFEVVAEPLAWRDRPVVLPADQERRLLALASRAPTPGCIHVDHFFRPELRPRADARLNVWRTMFETDRVPVEWVEAARHVDQIWVPSEFNRQTFASSGIPDEKLRVLPPCYDFSRFRPGTPPLVVEGARGFNFLSLFDWSLRKGWDLLLAAYVAEFDADEDVALIIKTHSSLNLSIQEIAREIEGYVTQVLGRSLSSLPEIILQDANLPQQRLPHLYAAGDCFVLPTRGEGWGRPCMEAMAMGLPVIATGWSGHTAFMTQENSRLLPYEIVEVPERAWRETPTYRGHRWAEPSVPALRDAMRWMEQHRDAARALGANARRHVLENYSREAFVRNICALLGMTPPEDCSSAESSATTRSEAAARQGTEAA